MSAGRPDRSSALLVAGLAAPGRTGDSAAGLFEDVEDAEVRAAPDPRDTGDTAGTGDSAGAA
ncbi:hypothetical protein [Frankia sp. Cppng1_Ct_nod]|uniref:hypothetical protein n=1 Tax=Frankia sp. Cppng1_Ct_nod TaxID=2897162 RepID=UPI0020241666|nr:hypothetical protein [Frankia sp. Cppng1_Ct_nod]